MSLSNTNKLRHASSVRAMLIDQGTSITERSSKTVTKLSLSLLPKKRVGSSRQPSCQLHEPPALAIQ